MTDTAAPTVHIRAFHNIDAGFLAYKPSDRVTLVFAADEPAAAPEAICEALFELLNIGDDPAFGTPDPRAVAYRERGNRTVDRTTGDAQSRVAYSSGLSRASYPQSDRHARRHRRPRRAGPVMLRSVRRARSTTPRGSSSSRRPSK